MKARNFTTMGSLHPILFFAGVYAVALLFSIFICSSLFYSFNSSNSSSNNEDKMLRMEEVVPAAMSASTTVAMR